MKRSSFLALASVFFLLSCSSETPGAAFDKGIVEANLLNGDVLRYEGVEATAFDPEEAMGSDYALVDDFFSSYGGGIYESSNGRRRAYSLYTSGAIGKPFDSSLDYRVVKSEIAGFYLYIETPSLAYVYDGFDHCLYEGDPILGISFSESLVAGEEAVTVSGTDQSGKIIADEYRYVAGSDGALEPVLMEWSNPQYPADGSSVDLTSIGLADMVLVTQGDGRYYVADSLGNIRSSFYIPTWVDVATSAFYFAGGHLVQEASFRLADDADDYAFWSNGAKYAIEGVSVDLLSGEISHFTPDYLLASTDISDPFYDADGNPSAVMASVCLIGENRHLSRAEKVALDGEGNILYHLNGIDPTAFYKMGNGYYFNTANSAIYDEELVLVKDLSGFEASYVPSVDAIHLVDGLTEALLSPDGKFLIPLANQSLYFPACSDPLVYVLGGSGLWAYEVAYDEEKGSYRLAEEIALKNFAEGYAYALTSRGLGLYSLAGLNASGTLDSLDIYFGGELLGSYRLSSGSILIESVVKSPLLGNGFVLAKISGGAEIEATVLYRAIA